MQKYFTIAVVIAILYTAYTNSEFGQKNSNIVSDSAENLSKAKNLFTDKVEGEEEIKGSFVERTLSKVFLNLIKTEEGKDFLYNMIKPVNGPIDYQTFVMDLNDDQFLQNLLQIKVLNKVENNSNHSTYCGTNVTADYIIKDLNNKIIEDNIVNFTLGTKTLLYGLENVIIGMKIGEKRSATIPPEFAYLHPSVTKNSENLPRTSVNVEVTLKEINNPDELQLNKISKYNDKFSFKIPYLCGQNIKMHVKITDFDGKLVFNSKSASDKKIATFIGSPELPIAINYGINNTTPDGTRAIITPGLYLKNSGNLVQVPNIADHKLYLVEIFELESDDLGENVIQKLREEQRKEVEQKIQILQNAQ